MTDRQRLIFNMKYFDDMPYEDIAAILDVAVGTLKATYHNAVKKIEEKTYVFSISLFHSAWGALFRTSVAVQGTQRGSNATPLRVPASGGVWLI